MILRIELFAAKLQDTGDQRFAIEKDKCVMLDMLEKMGLPFPRVRQTWRAFDAADVKRFLLETSYRTRAGTRRDEARLG